MQFKRGDYRFVVVLPMIGIVLKFPLVHLATVLWSILRALVHFDFLSFWVMLRMPADPSQNRSVCGYQNRLFGGIMVNWREFVFFIKSRHHPFLLPTYLSVLGFINIQKLGTPPCNLKRGALWRQLYELTKGEVWDDGHHFSNPENFCLPDGRLTMIDYGQPKTWQVVIKYGKKIVDRFDPAIRFGKSKS